MQWLLKYILKIKPNFEEGKNYIGCIRSEATETILFSTDEKQNLHLISETVLI